MTGREIRYRELPACEGWTLPIWSYTDWDEFDHRLFTLSSFVSENLDTLIETETKMRKTETGTVRVLVGTDLPAWIPHIVEFRSEARERYDEPLALIALQEIAAVPDYEPIVEWSRIRQDLQAIQERAIELGRESELEIGFQWEWF